MPNKKVSQSDIPMSRPVSIFDAASYILEKSPWTITQSELHELLYLSQMFHLGIYSSPLMSARFQAWKYAPINEDLFDQLGKYGNDVLVSSNVSGNFNNIVEESHKSILDFVIDNLSDRTAPELYTLTHHDGGAWQKTHNPRYPNLHIPDRLLKEEFEAKIKQVQNKFDYAEAEIDG